MGQSPLVPDARTREYADVLSFKKINLKTNNMLTMILVLYFIGTIISYNVLLNITVLNNAKRKSLAVIASIFSWLFLIVLYIMYKINEYEQ